MATTRQPDTANVLEAKGTSPATGPAKPRFESIDGLRGLACLMVLSFHCWVYAGHYKWPEVMIGHMTLPIYRLMSLGYGGVDMFFVLSGFCLAYPILSRPNKKLDWRQFFINRVRRIVPPYWSAVALFALLSVVISHYHVQPFYRDNLLGWPKARQLFYCITLISTAFNMAFWTLPIEWRWYFVLPLLIAIWRKSPAAVVLLSVAVCAASSLLYPPFHTAKFAFWITLLPTFLPYFALGILAASISINERPGRIERFLIKIAHMGAAGAVCAIIFVDPTYSVQLFSMLVKRLVTWGPLCFFLVVLATRPGNGTFQKVLSWKPLVSVGVFSYSLYLVHGPFVEAIYHLTKQQHWSPLKCFFIYQGLVLPCIVLLGYLFFLVAEKPFLRRPVKRAIAAEQTFVLAAPKPTAEA